MSNVDDFLRYRADAVALFPVLNKYAIVETQPGEISYLFDADSYKTAGVPLYNVPPGFDVNANQSVYSSAYHEPGHELDNWLNVHDPQKKHHDAFMKFFGLAGTWDNYKTYSAGLQFPDSWYADPGEMWADAFADAVSGEIKQIHRHSQLKVPADAASVRTFFQSLLPAAPQPQPAPQPAPTPAPALRHMYDALYAANIPTFATVIAGYVDGSHPWSDADFAKFENDGKTVVRICIWNNRFDADVIDIEGGNNDAKGAVPWIKGMWDLGRTPTVYCYSDKGPQGYRISDVRAECDAEGVKYPLFWIAKAGDGSSFDPSGDPSIVALQYEYDGTYDVSVIADNWPIKEAPVTQTTGGDGGSATPNNAIVRVGQSADRITVKTGEVAVLQAIFEWPSGVTTTVVKRIVSYVPGFHTVEVYPPLDPKAEELIEVRATEPAVFVITVN